MTEPTDNDLDALILQHWPAAATATLPLRWIREAFREGLAKWGTPAPVGAEPAGEAGAMPGTSGFTMACFHADAVPIGTKLYATPQPTQTQTQAEAVPLDEARRLFDAGWKAAARFCDREDVVADGTIGFGACPQFEAAFAAAHDIKGGQHDTDI